MTKPWILTVGSLATAVVLALAGAALAGECPADQIVADGMGQQSGASEPQGVRDTVLGAIDLAREPVGIDDRLFRLRRLAIEPGGVVPWHSHDDRPALIYVAIGQVTEYASDCAVPILHFPGQVSVERHGRSHWWKNTGDSTAVLLSADLLQRVRFAAAENLAMQLDWYKDGQFWMGDSSRKVQIDFIQHNATGFMNWALLEEG